MGRILNPVQSLVPFGAFGPRAAMAANDYPISTLVLGLGQVGWHAASLMGDIVKTAFAASTPGRIQVYAIASRPPVIPAGWLYKEDCLLLTLSETDWAHVPTYYARSGVARWWPKPPRDRENIPDYTLLRAYGRLLLFEDPGLVHDELYRRVMQLVYQSTQPPGDGRRQIIIVTSIAEAEGSALLMDIVSVLRTQLVDSPTTILAILTADTNANAQNDAARTQALANAYATLKEIDAIMLNPTHYQLGLPVLNRTAKLTRVGATRPLDYLLFTGDAATTTSDNVPPAAALVEMATTWMLAQSNRAEPPLPLSGSAEAEHFDGYTTFSISKLGVPTSGAVDLIGCNLAGHVLANIAAEEGNQDNATIADWASAQIESHTEAISLDAMLALPGVQYRWQELLTEIGPERLKAEIDQRKSDPNYTLHQLIEGTVHRLDEEDRATAVVEEKEQRLDTLRTRLEDAYKEYAEGLEAPFSVLFTQLVGVEGHSLPWVINALDLMLRKIDRRIDYYQQAQVDVQQAWLDARDEAMALAFEYDKVYSGMKRRLRFSDNSDLSTALSGCHAAAQSLIEHILCPNMVLVWQKLRSLAEAAQNRARVMLQTLELTSQTIAEYAETLRVQIDNALKDSMATFPAGTLIDNDWLQRGMDSLPSFDDHSDDPSETLATRLFRHWSENRPGCNLEDFLESLIPACREFLTQVGALRFTPLRQYLLSRVNSPVVMQALEDLQVAAIPKWVPSKPLATRTAHEWIRVIASAGTTNLSLLPPVPGDLWRRFNIQSPDPDEICLIRLVHGITAESIEQVRGQYRRAYERVTAEGVPLHLDRRWMAMLQDLVSNRARKRASDLWEAALQGSVDGPAAIEQPLAGLIGLLARSLDITQAAVQIRKQTNEFILAVFQLPKSRLRLPPSQCAVVFSFGRHDARQIGRNIHRAVTELGLAEPFAFVVNVNNFGEIDTVAKTLKDAGFDVVVLGEANFKSVVGSPQPLRTLHELVLAAVDLTLVSPFHTKAPVPERMFYGREREIKEVQWKIKTHSVALIGGRRIGKTSALQQVERLLRQPESGYVPYYLDCSYATSYTHFFNAINEHWKVRNPAAEPTAFVKLVGALKEHHPHAQLIFLFDEVDRLLITDQSAADSDLLFRTFRALSNEGRCQFIFSGERSLARAMLDSYSPMFNFAQPVPLGLLERPEVARLVAEPFEMMNIWLDDDVALIDKIFRLSAGHPNIVQMICEQIVASMNADRENAGLLSMEYLDKALDDHKLQEEIIHVFWGQMGDLACLITLLWPVDEPFLSLEDILQNVQEAGLNPVSIREIQEALKDLELYCFVEPQGRQYRLVPYDFPALLRRMMPVELEIAARIENLQQNQPNQHSQNFGQKRGTTHPL